MKRGWTEVALGEVLVPVARFEPKDDSKTYSFAGTYSYARGIFKSVVKTGSSFNLPLVQRIKAGDFIYCKIMAWEGAFGLAPSDVDGCVMSGAFVACQPDTSKINPGFLSHWFRSETNWRRVSASSTGTNVRRKSLAPDDFLKALIPLPPLAEQQRIAARLDAIETRLTRVQQLREEQTQKLQAALRSAFHALVVGAVWKPLSEVAPLAWRKITIDPEASYTEFGVRSFYKGIFLRRKVSGAIFDWQELYRLREGDIVFSNIMAWEKAIGVASAEQDGWVGNHRMLICEPRPDVILGSCLYHYFMTDEGFAKILKASPGTAARNKTLKADHLMALEVPVPPLTAQREFQKLLALQAQVTARAAESEAATTAILPSLLDQIFAT